MLPKYLDTVTLPVTVTESMFSLPLLGRYIPPLTTLNRYLSRGMWHIFLWYPHHDPPLSMRTDIIMRSVVCPRLRYKYQRDHHLVVSCLIPIEYDELEMNT